jgi:hypothetical protein
MLEILDGIIATATVVLALSLIVQSIQQILKQLLSMKSSYMERELIMMFLPDEALKKLSDQLKTFKNKIIPDWKLLSNISKEDRIVVDQIKLKMQSLGYHDLEVLEKMNEAQLINIVSSLPMFVDHHPDVPGPLSDAIDDVRTWFEITKQAFQDHYERKMRLWAFWISTIVVIILNADIGGIYKEFTLSKSRRDAIVQVAPVLFNFSEKVADSLSSNNGKQKKDNSNKTSIYSDSLIQSKLKTIDTLVTTFELIRWNSPMGDSLHISCNQVSIRQTIIDFYRATRKNILGWIGMTLLVSLGAPFWYDLLKTFMGIKNQFKEKKDNK